MKAPWAEKLNKPLQWLVMLGFLTLPYTHFKWMPDLGTTRPVSVVVFALAFGMVVLQAATANRFRLRAWFHWASGWDNWPALRWWLGFSGRCIVTWRNGTTGRYISPA